MAAILTQRPADSLSEGPLEAVTAVELFSMGFSDAQVGSALVACRGDAQRALALLQAEDESSEEKELERAIQLSLAPDESMTPTARETQPSLTAEDPDTTTTHEAQHAQLPSTSANPFWAPPRYVPAGERSVGGPRTLNLVELVEIRDGGYEWQRARAFLDTGNQLMTLVDTNFASRHAVYRPSHTALGCDTRFGQAERWTTIRGVVPGVSSRAPVVTIALKVRDEEFLIQAAVSELGTHDLLLGTDVLGRLFASGFRIGAGSM